ncbi:SAM-dependent methyltransferase [Streptomyces huiliensis]|uniref:SAM-dependent methyltransferase n=1 Tax=Streptomyces huiliensis TaxID=2876027 RepID=UPI001CC008D9|nr:methyltransferase domain-containing protein [Streptomyces huiliensis]MBZ4324008.1 methyltransferase domain-containing protein [Streptomyces huiliensis]
MISGYRDVTPEAIAELYDRYSERTAALLGGSIHFGHWPDPADDASVAAASGRMTRLMTDALEVGPGDRVLDAGCGTGRPALQLARATGAAVTGITLSGEQVRLASAAADAEGLSGRVSFRLADAADLPFPPGSFDGAWLFESLLHMPDPGRVLRGIHDVLRPGARLAIANVVERAPLPAASRPALDTFCELNRIAAILPLAGYPALIADAGLAVESVTDVSDHSVPQTFHALCTALRAAGPDDSTEDREEWEAMVTAMERLAVTPEVGYAIVVASKPLRPLRPE